MTGTRRYLALIALLLGALSVPAQAQDTDAVPAPSVAQGDARVAPADSAAVVARAVRGGPALAATVSGVRALEADRAAETGRGVSLAAQRQRFSQAETLMIVGGVTFLAGAVIGDDAGTLIMIGGAAIGIYGLFLYLQ
jgi:hypothetical protein